MGWFSSGPKVLGFFDYRLGEYGRPERFVMYAEDIYSWSVYTTYDRLAHDMQYVAEDIDEFAVPGVEFLLYASYHGPGWREVRSTLDAKRGSQEIGSFAVQSAGVGRRLLNAWSEGDFDQDRVGLPSNKVWVRLGR